MKYRVFNTEQEALDAEEAIAAAIGCVKVGTNAKTGEPEPDKQRTVRWAIPQQIQDGRWVFVSPDDVGENPGDDWWPEHDIYL